jgi:hypothetical protein
LSNVPKPGGGQIVPAAQFNISDGRFLSADNLLVRLNNGDLMLLWQAGTWSAFDSTLPWWGFMNDPANDGDPAKNPNGNHAGERAAMYTWRSSDCGESWTAMPVLDSAKLFDGVCAWPQEVNGGPWIGGWDRPEVYVDPWSSKIYLSTMCRSGTALKFPTDGTSKKTDLAFPGKGRTDAVLVTLDPTKASATWEPVFFLGDHGGNNSMPIPITTTENGRMFLFQCQGSINPVLFWFDPASPNDVTKLDLSHDDEGQPTSFWCNAVDQETHTKIVFLPASAIPAQPINAAGLAIARGVSTSDRDEVRVAYNAFEGGRQVEKIVTVGVKRTVAKPTRKDKTITVKLTRTVTAQADDGSILWFALIDANPKEFNAPAHATVAYWIESDPGADQLRARMGMLRPKDWTDVDLSTNPLSWTPQFRANGWGGDYIKGAFFTDGTTLGFAPVWTESDAAPTKPNLNIHYTVLKAAP